MSADGLRTKWCGNIAENFNLLSRAHERYSYRQTTDRQTDDRQMTYSEHELIEFTFAKNVSSFDGVPSKRISAHF